MIRLKMSIPRILAFSLAVAYPLNLSSQSTAIVDTAPRTQEESDRIQRHGALPKYSRLAGRNLRDKLKKTPGVSAKVVIGEGLLMNSPQGQPDFAQEWLRNQLCRSGRVVVVRMSKQISGLTKNESLVDSDYYFTLEKIIYSRDASSNPPKGSTVVVNTLGGVVDLPEGRASTVIQGMSSFERGKRYLIFLKRIAGADDYEPTDLGGAFLLPEHGSPKNLYEQTGEGLQNYLSKLNSESLIDRIIEATNAVSGCKGAIQ